MTMRFAPLLAAVLVLAPVLQSTVLYRAGPGGVTVDLVLLGVVAAASGWGPVSGVLWGFAGGLMLGAAYGHQALHMATLYATVGWAAGCLPRHWLAQIAGLSFIVLALPAAEALLVRLPVDALRTPAWVALHLPLVLLAALLPRMLNRPRRILLTHRSAAA